MKKDIWSWTLAVVVVIGLVSVGDSWLHSGAMSVDSVPVSVLGAAVTIAITLGIARWLPLWRVGSLKWMVLAIAVGVVSTRYVVFPEGHLFNVFQGMGWSDHWAAVAGPLCEETYKGIGVLLVLMVARRVWDRPWHGLLAGVGVGLGFGIQEDFGYAVMGARMNAWTDVQGASQMWIWRSLPGFDFHAIMTGIVGAGLGMALLTTWPVARRVAAAVLALLVAMGLHAGWNAASLVVVQGALQAVGVAVLVGFIIAWWRPARADRFRVVPPHWVAWGLPQPRPVGTPGVGFGPAPAGVGPAGIAGVGPTAVAGAGLAGVSGAAQGGVPGFGPTGVPGAAQAGVAGFGPVSGAGVTPAGTTPGYAGGYGANPAEGYAPAQAVPNQYPAATAGLNGYPQGYGAGAPAGDPSVQVAQPSGGASAPQSGYPAGYGAAAPGYSAPVQGYSAPGQAAQTHYPAANYNGYPAGYGTAGQGAVPSAPTTNFAAQPSTENTTTNPAEQPRAQEVTPNPADQPREQDAAQENKPGA